MTIAACYLSPEGVVFGSDSTTTIAHPGGSQHHLDFGQKIFELGHDATLGIVTWGLGGFQQTSYRTLYAEFADDLRGNAPATVEDAAKRWAAKFYSVYDSVVGPIYRAEEAAAPTPEAKEAVRKNLIAGFCIGGIALPNRRPFAYEVEFSPTDTGVPDVEALPMGEAIFRGVPMLVNRILFGIDPAMFEAIAASPKWTGTKDELLALVAPHVLGHPAMLPIRDAIDWIYSCIQATIKGVKFSPLPPICGGPVEIAVVTSDRPFRWVRHKSLDAAVNASISGTHGDAL